MRGPYDPCGEFGESVLLEGDVLSAIQAGIEGCSASPEQQLCGSSLP